MTADWENCHAGGADVGMIENPELRNVAEGFNAYAIGRLPAEHGG